MAVLLTRLLAGALVLASLPVLQAQAANKAAAPAGPTALSTFPLAIPAHDIDDHIGGTSRVEEVDFAIAT